MGETLSKSDVARILKIQEASVQRLIEQGGLSGTQSDGEWHTTQSILAGDLTLLAENARIQRFQEGKYISPWTAGSKESDPGYIPPEKIAAIIEKHDAGPAQH